MFHPIYVKGGGFVFYNNLLYKGGFFRGGRCEYMKREVEQIIPALVEATESVKMGVQTDGRHGEAALMRALKLGETIAQTKKVIGSEATYMAVERILGSNTR